MIRKNGEFITETREKMRGGEGKVTIEKIWEPGKDLKAKTRLFAKLILEPGSSIGFHKHENEEEVFLILKGEAELDDNGKTSLLKAGDSILTGGGAGHSVKCSGKSPLEILAVISEY
ncbi:MAG TPA: cupin domain-containing protein [Victivallales bacterium]|nr:cupin domain-containing protein [Victivallales bacterium]